MDAGAVGWGVMGMTIKPGDKFKTRDGHEVEITKIRDGEYPIIGRLGTFGANTKGWTADGHYYADKRPSEIIHKIPKPDKDGWIEAGVEEIASMMVLHGSLLTRTRIKDDRLVTEYLLPLRAPERLWEDVK